MIAAERLHIRRGGAPRPEGRYVLYWMQQSQRAGFNPALEFAVEQANALDLPVLVAFALFRHRAGSSRTYAFMLQGLAEAALALEKRGIGFVMRRDDPVKVVGRLAGEAALVVCDRGYLRGPRAARDALAARLDVPFTEVEGDAVVPVETASRKHEYAARTIRPRLQRLWDDQLAPLAPRLVRRRWRKRDGSDGLDLARPAALLASLGLGLGGTPPAVRRFQGGEAHARQRLAAFLDDGLGRYAEERGRPEARAGSELSPYLHFGQISPVEVALAVRSADAPRTDRQAFLEELIVRRELAINHAWFEPAYDRWEGLPDWSRKALAKAAADPRPHLYTPAQLEAGATHDRYWNAAMREMTATGFMHNRLRMYWGKKILQWSPRPEQAYETTLMLNDRWFLDGRDANSYTNVGWIFGLHDRPWGPQPVFGTVRSMGPNLFKRFDAEAYVADVERMAAVEDV